MSSEHIYRDWTGHTKEVIRPSHEYCGVEIFSYEHSLTKSFHPANYTFKGKNHKKTRHRHLNCLESKSNEAFTVDLVYNVQELGDYRIDVLYENKNSKDYVGRYNIEVSERSKAYPTSKVQKSHKPSTKNINKKIKQKEPSKSTNHWIVGKDLKFEGEKNILKRKTIFPNFKFKGNHTFVFELPHNCYFVGVIIRKIKMFTGDNLDSVGTNLELTECDVTASSETDPKEANFTVGYSQFFDNPLTRSGFYMDYMDEVNIYFRVNADVEGKVIRRFGGYISSVTLDDKREHLKFSCADRLQDGEDKFILDSLVILYGTGSDSELNYLNPINFNNYGQALKYLCSIHELTLKSNIRKNNLVKGEKYTTGLNIKFGKKKDIKKVKTTNMTATPQKSFITIRNKASASKTQTATLYSTNKPVNITNHLTFHMMYGMGATKTTKKNTVYDEVDTTANSAGSQKFGKCGVSADKKYVMGIGQRGVGRNSSNYPYGTYYKSVFENKCPYCHQATLRWDSCRTDTKCIFNHGRSGSKRNFPVPANETEITCENCDTDFDVPTGYSKEGQYKYKLKKVRTTVKSSKAEQTKLHQGKMTAVAKTGEKLSAESVLKSVASIAKKYSYERGAATTYAQLKKKGKGDCHAFSDCIFTELKKLKVACRIYEFATGYSNTHQEVYYKNANNKWVRFPYQKYGLNKMLYTTKGANLKSTPHKRYDSGTNIAHVTSKGGGTSTQKTEVTTTKGYDKDKPLQCYIQIKYATQAGKNAKTKNVNLNFTLKANTNSDLTGLSTIWVNNSTRLTSVDMRLWFADNEPNKQIYLHEIKLIAPKIKVTDENQKEANWYTFDKQTHDYSSCKMDLYYIVFDDNRAINPTDLQSCGKTVQSVLEDIVEQSKYRVHMTYGLHRRDDKIYFLVDNQTDPAFVATEGDNNNILKWSNIKYSPVSELKNRSICVFKQENKAYSYVDTGNIGSILRYGEKTTLTTSSEPIGSKEAYFNARNSSEYNPEQFYSYTIVVPYAPNLKLGDLVKVVSNYKKLNDVKTVESIKISYSKSDMPRIQTEIGLDEIEPYLRIKKEQEKLRKKTRAERVYFGKSASLVDTDDIYIWD